MLGRRQFLKRIAGLAFFTLAGSAVAPGKKGFAMAEKVLPDTGRLLLFRDYVAGFRYYEGEEFLVDLNPGEILCLKREPDNPYDENAIEIHTQSGVKLGYVPGDINTIPASMLDQEITLKAEITEINFPPDPQWERDRFAVFQIG